MNDDEKLRQAYYDPRTMGSLTKLLRLFKGSISPDIIRAFVRRQQYSQLVARKPRVFMPILAKPRQAQADLMFFPYRGALKPILCVVVVETRVAYCRALKSKGESDMVSGLRSVVEEDHKITSLVTDAGKEFVNKGVAKLLKQHRVQLTVMQPGYKTAVGIVERFNRTLRDLLSRYTETVGIDWPKALPTLVENYNNNFHRMLGTNPDAMTHALAASVAARQRLHALPYLQMLDGFHHGDTVRVALQRKAFSKGNQVFGKALHTVESIVGYRVETDDGELHPARDLQHVGDVQQPALVRGVPEARRLQKAKAKRAMHEIEDYTAASADKKSLRSAGSKEMEAIRFRTKVPRALAALQDFNGMPAQ